MIKILSDENEIILDENIAIMAEEPLKNVSASDFEEYFKDKTSEQNIADAYAAAHEKYAWVEDNTYDYEEGTEEYGEALKICDDWHRIKTDCENKIFEILKKDEIIIPEKGIIKVLIPFMKKYGYDHDHGWWIKTKKQEKDR